MKRARLWLLLFLAVLLPVRGAVAAAMLCAMPIPAPQAPGHHAPALHAAEGHAHHAHQAPESQAVADGKCNLCAASCGLTPLPSSAPAVAEPPARAAAAFPEIEAAPASFLADGPERPPRSI